MEKIILLQHFNIFSLTFWMLTLLWMPEPVTPLLPPPLLYATRLRWATSRKLESRMGKSGYDNHVQN